MSQHLQPVMVITSPAPRKVPSRFSVHARIDEQMLTRIWLWEGAGWKSTVRVDSCPQTYIHTPHIYTQTSSPNNSNPTGQAPRSDMGAGGIPWALPSDMHPRVWWRWWCKFSMSLWHGRAEYIEYPGMWNLHHWLSWVSNLLIADLGTFQLP